MNRIKDSEGRICSYNGIQAFHFWRQQLGQSITNDFKFAAKSLHQL